MISPAGAATMIARVNTKSVRSRSERTRILPICGLLYGGSSSVNDDGNPFNMVADKSRDTASVIKTPRIIAVSTVRVAAID